MKCPHMSGDSVCSVCQDLADARRENLELHEFIESCDMMLDELGIPLKEESYRLDFKERLASLIACVHFQQAKLEDLLKSKSDD